LFRVTNKGLDLNFKYRFVYLVSLLFLGVQILFAQQESNAADRPLDMPLVSLIGEDEDIFNTLAETHGDVFLEVCGNDMDLAYDKWMDMLVAMEDYSAEINYDIRGLKTYLYVFWNADGTIKHLAFYPKPNSRNISIAELKAFFKGFVKEYKMSVTAERGFSHYASGSFPTFGRSELSAKRN
jgi:hypothetical protein